MWIERAQRVEIRARTAAYIDRFLDDSYIPVIRIRLLPADGGDIRCSICCDVLCGDPAFSIDPFWMRIDDLPPLPVGVFARDLDRCIRGNDSQHGAGCGRLETHINLIRGDSSYRKDRWLRRAWQWSFRESRRYSPRQC